MVSRLSNRTKRIVIGIVFLGIGIGYLGTQMNWWNFTIFFPGWWTMLLIIPACISLIDQGIYFSNIFIIFLGAYFLAEANAWINFQLTFPMFMALMCICIGIRLLFTRRIKWYGYKADGYKD